MRFSTNVARAPFPKTDLKISQLHWPFCRVACLRNLSKVYSFDYNWLMNYTVKRLDEFSDWLNGLKDALTRQRLIKRLRKVQLGNLGDVQPVGEGVFEMREHFGPGWRMYYVRRAEVLIVVLGGGDKATQQSDINRAIELAQSLEN